MFRIVKIVLVQKFVQFVCYEQMYYSAIDGDFEVLRKCRNWINFPFNRNVLMGTLCTLLVL